MYVTIWVAERDIAQGSLLAIRKKLVTKSTPSNVPYGEG
jgi:hypothetical protein